MKFEFSVENIPKKSFRTDLIKSSYDIKDEKFIQSFSGDIEIENKQWNIGLIVGSSGSGKSTITKKIFGEFKKLKWTKSEEGHSFLDDFDQNCSNEEIQKNLSNVGFSSPPHWMKPFHVLSVGEKMRVELARLITESKENEPIIFDEFTSVVDRQIAQITSSVINKSIKKTNKKFIAISCHRDIIEWLEPDWIYDTDEKRFFFAQMNLKDQNWKSILDHAKEKCGPILKNIII